MIQVFKNCALNISIVLAFFLSHVVNVNASYSRNNLQKEIFSTSRIKQEGKKEASIITIPYTLTLNGRGENKDLFEGKVEKVVSPLTIALGILAAGYTIHIVGSIIGWVKDLILVFK